MHGLQTIANRSARNCRATAPVADTVYLPCSFRSVRNASATGAAALQTYIRSGTSIPSNPNPTRSVRIVTRQSVSRVSRWLPASALSTGHASKNE